MSENVYYGVDSVAKIVIGNDLTVRNPKDLMAVAYALAYDSKDKYLLSHNPNELLLRTPQRVAGRYSILYKLAEQIDPSMQTDIRKMEELTFELMDGKISKEQYIDRIRAIASKYLSPYEIRYIEQRLEKPIKNRLTVNIK